MYSPHSEPPQDAYAQLHGSSVRDPHRVAACAASDKGIERKTAPDWGAPLRLGGLKGSTQHFILEDEMEWMRWSGDMFEVLMQWRRRSCGSAGGVGSR